jgi:hypothetical protein
MLYPFPDYLASVYKLPFSVIPARPESLLRKDSRRAEPVPTCSGLAGMTNDCSLYTDSILSIISIFPLFSKGGRCAEESVYNPGLEFNKPGS